MARVLAGIYRSSTSQPSASCSLSLLPQGVHLSYHTILKAADGLSHEEFAVFQKQQHRIARLPGSATSGWDFQFLLAFAFCRSVAKR